MSIFDDILDMAGDVGGGIVSGRYGKRAAGNLLYRTAQGLNYLDDVGPLEYLIPGENPGSGIVRAYEEGYQNDGTGGRAVWERMQSDNPLPLRAAMDIAVDPFTYLTGGGGVLASGLARLPRAARLGLGTDAVMRTGILGRLGMRQEALGAARGGVGGAIQRAYGTGIRTVADVGNIPNLAAEAVLGPVLGGGAKVAGRVAGAVTPGFIREPVVRGAKWLVEPSKEAKYRSADDQLTQDWFTTNKRGQAQDYASREAANQWVFTEEQRQTAQYAPWTQAAKPNPAARLGAKARLQSWWSAQMDPSLGITPGGVNAIPVTPGATGNALGLVPGVNPPSFASLAPEQYEDLRTFADDVVKQHAVQEATRQSTDYFAQVQGRVQGFRSTVNSRAKESLGRELDTAELMALWDDTARAGGWGKSRLLSDLNISPGAGEDELDLTFSDNALNWKAKSMVTALLQLGTVGQDKDDLVKLFAKGGRYAAEGKQAASQLFAQDVAQGRIGNAPIYSPIDDAAEGRTPSLLTRDQLRAQIEAELGAPSISAPEDLAAYEQTLDRIWLEGVQTLWSTWGEVAKESDKVVRGMTSEVAEAARAEGFPTRTKKRPDSRGNTEEMLGGGRNLPNQEEFERAYRTQQAAKGTFYGDQVLAFAASFEGPEEFTRFLNLNSAYSAQTPVDVNAQRAVDALALQSTDLASVLNVGAGVEEDDLASFARRYSDGEVAEPVVQDIVKRASTLRSIRDLPAKFRELVTKTFGRDVPGVSQGMWGHLTNSLRNYNGLSVSGLKYNNFRTAFLHSRDYYGRMESIAREMGMDPTTDFNDFAKADDVQKFMTTLYSRNGAEADLHRKILEQEINRRGGLTDDVWHQRFLGLSQNPRSQDSYMAQSEAGVLVSDRIRARAIEQARQLRAGAGSDEGAFGNLARDLAVTPDVIQEAIWAYMRGIGGEGLSYTTAGAFGKAMIGNTELPGPKDGSMKQVVNEKLLARGIEYVSSLATAARTAKETLTAEGQPLDLDPITSYLSIDFGGGKALHLDQALNKIEGRSSHTAKRLGRQGYVLADFTLPAETFERDLVQLRLHLNDAIRESAYNSGFTVFKNPDDTFRVMYAYYPEFQDSSRFLAGAITARSILEQNAANPGRAIQQLPTQMLALKNAEQVAHSFAGLPGTVKKGKGGKGRWTDESTIGNVGTVKDFWAGRGRTRFAGQTPAQVWKRLKDGGTEDGHTFAPVLNPDGSLTFQDDPLTDGIAVAFTSAGKNGWLSDRSPEIDATKFLRELTPLMFTQNPNLRIGMYSPGDGKVALDISYVTDDVELAKQIGRIANQVSIYGASVGSIETGGTGNSPYKTVEDIMNLLDAIEIARAGDGIIDPPIPGSSDFKETATSLGDARNLGSSRAPLEPTDPAAALRLTSMPAGAANMAADLGDKLFVDLPERLRRSIDAPDIDPDERAADLIARELTLERANFKDHLSLEENERLYGGRFKNGRWAGRTYGEVLEANRDMIARLKQDMTILGVQAPRDADPKDIMAAFKRRIGEARVSAEVRQKLTKNLKDLLDSGVDPLHDDPVKAAMEMVRPELRTDLGLDAKEKANGTLRLLRGAWAELALFSPRYHMANIMGGLMNAWISGSPVTGGAEFFGEIQRTFKGADSVDIEPEYLKRLAEYGLAKTNTVTTDTMRADVLGGGSNIGKLAKKIPGVNDRAAQLIGKPFEASRNFGRAIDATIRGAVYVDAFEAEFQRGLPELTARLKANSQKAGYGIPIELFPDNIQGKYNPGYLKEYYIQQGVPEGYAARMSRDVAELVNRSDAAAKKQVKRSQFSYERKNIDELVSKVVPFHYWATRATRFYAEEALKNPVLAINFARAIEGIDRMNEDPEFNARQKSWLNIMNGPKGFSLMMNPLAMFSFTKAIGVVDNHTPEGETEIGHLLRKMKEYGIGLYPWVDGMFNMVGAYGDTYEPDLLGIRHRALVGAAVNEVRAQLGMGPGGDPYADLNNAARAAVSKVASNFLPSLLSNPVQANAGGALGGAYMESLIESRVIANNPGLPGANVLAIMLDPNHPEYEKAFQEVARAGLVGQALNFVAPVQMKTRENSRDVRSAQIRLIGQAADEEGVNPWDYVPTMEDLEFAANYKNQTGQDWKPGDFEKATTERALINANPEVKPYIVMENQYQELVPEGIAEQERKYYAIIDGSWWPTTGGPAPYGTTEQERKWAADFWLRQQPAQGDMLQVATALRDSYRATHPEFDQFKQWQGNMYRIKGAYGSLAKYRELAAQGNPNAAAYFQRTAQRILAEGGTPEEMSQRMDEATTSIEAWMAINGIARNRMDPVPQSTGAAGYDPSGPMAQTATDWTALAEQGII